MVLRVMFIEWSGLHTVVPVMFIEWSGSIQCMYVKCIHVHVCMYTVVRVMFIEWSGLHTVVPVMFKTIPPFS